MTHAAPHTTNSTRPCTRPCNHADLLISRVASACIIADVGDIICNHSRAEPCVPLHAIAETCDSARLWDDISDSWNQPEGNGAGVKNYIDFWVRVPQSADYS
eukprot:COSAG06_NODE_12424_length_1388_cov_1.412451_2_plen_102_part_00